MPSPNTAEQNTDDVALGIVWRKDVDDVLIHIRPDEPEDGLLRYVFPGGKIHVDEHYFDAAAREVEEETGVIVEPTDVIASRKLDQPGSPTLYYVECEYIQSPEPGTQDSLWVPRSELIETLNAPIFPRVLTYLQLT